MCAKGLHVEIARAVELSLQLAHKGKSVTNMLEEFGRLDSLCPCEHGEIVGMKIKQQELNYAV
jgi:hypothetical protein